MSCYFRFHTEIIHQVITRRRKEFASLELGPDLATARVDMLSKIVRGTYGIVVVEEQLMIAQGKQLIHIIAVGEAQT